MKEHTYPLKMDHIAAGVCYYPEHWGETYWKKDLQLMKELGLETARVGEFAWNFFEPREGVYDFALFDRFLDEAKEAGVKIIFCTPTCTPPAWLSRRYPETLNTTIEGNPYRHGMRQHHNMTSPVYLEKCDRLIEAMASHFAVIRPSSAGSWTTRSTARFLPIILRQITRHSGNISSRNTGQLRNTIR